MKSLCVYLLPPENALQKLVQAASESPWVKFWHYFNEKKYERAQELESTYGTVLILSSVNEQVYK
jgi:hypothetical protein